MLEIKIITDLIFSNVVLNTLIETPKLFWKVFVQSLAMISLLNLFVGFESWIPTCIAIAFVLISRIVKQCAVYPSEASGFMIDSKIIRCGLAVGRVDVPADILIRGMQFASVAVLVGYMGVVSGLIGGMFWPCCIAGAGLVGHICLFASVIKRYKSEV